MISVAIIGAVIGREHLRGYLALPELYSDKTLCDLEAVRAEAALREEVGGDAQVRTTSELEGVLADPNVDLVDVCLPPQLHFPVAGSELRAGKHVVVEKPMVTSLAEADALNELAKAADRIVSPVFQYCFGPAISQLRVLQDAGLTGHAHAASIETHWNRGVDYYAVPWRGTWEGENGSSVLVHAIHNHDLLTSILGPISSLSAQVATRVNEMETEDSAAICFQMEGGALATSSITLGAATDTTRFCIVFEGLTAESGTTPYAPATDTWTFTSRDPADQAKIDEVTESVGEVRAGFSGFFTELARRVSNQDHRAVTIDDGRRSIELVAAIYQAAREGSRVRLPLNKSAPLCNGWAPGAEENT